MLNMYPATLSKDTSRDSLGRKTKATPRKENIPVTATETGKSSQATCGNHSTLFGKQISLRIKLDLENSS